MSQARSQSGFTMIGLLIGLLLTTVLMTAGLSTLSTSTTFQNQQDVAMGMEQNLRVALDGLSSALVMTGSVVPDANLDTWIPWVTGFTANPLITTSPVSLSEAHCTAFPILETSAAATAGDTTVTVSSAVAGVGLAQLVNTADKMLIAIDDETFAHITDVDVPSSLLTIDTDPITAGNQGLSRAFPVGTRICRVDVSTFEVDAVNDALGIDANDGVGAQYFAEQISALEINTLEAGKRYELVIHAESDRADPTTGSSMTRTLRRVVTLRN